MSIKTGISLSRASADANYFALYSRDELPTHLINILISDWRLCALLLIICYQQIWLVRRARRRSQPRLAKRWHSLRKKCFKMLITHYAACTSCNSDKLLLKWIWRLRWLQNGLVFCYLKAFLWELVTSSIESTEGMIKVRCLCVWCRVREASAASVEKVTGWPEIYALECLEYLRVLVLQLSRVWV